MLPFCYLQMVVVSYLTHKILWSNVQSSQCNILAILLKKLERRWFANKLDLDWNPVLEFSFRLGHFNRPSPKTILLGGLGKNELEAQEFGVRSPREMRPDIRRSCRRFDYTQHPGSAQ